MIFGIPVLDTLSAYRLVIKIFTGTTMLIAFNSLMSFLLGKMPQVNLGGCAGLMYNNLGIGSAIDIFFSIIVMGVVFKFNAKMLQTMF